MARITKDPDERRRELIACAQGLFYSKGYERTTVRDIVSELGIAKGTFYYYFDSKLAILEAMIDEALSQSVALLHEIVADQTLPVLVKWGRAFQVVGAWKVERKAELLAMLHVMQMDENLVLRYKMQTRAVQLLSPEFTKLVAQGVEEGVFQTEFLKESAGITLSIMQSLADPLYSILLSPDKYDDPVALAQREFAAVETAIERVLGAPPGSLSFVDTQALAVWFEDRR
ncbi:MAG: TetR/AcrR family transcriptional regulator [Anaerolineae bacterium]|jgi:AcrR family transcriptional regulator